LFIYVVLALPLCSLSLFLCRFEHLKEEGMKKRRVHYKFDIINIFHIEIVIITIIVWQYQYGSGNEFSMRCLHIQEEANVDERKRNNTRSLQYLTSPPHLLLNSFFFTHKIFTTLLLRNNKNLGIIIFKKNSINDDEWDVRGIVMVMSFNAVLN
jgi:hypothetical protein